jgi:hypothetical protein
LRRTTVIACLVAGTLLVAAVAQAGPPRLEQKRLRAADMALAKRIALRASDLPDGWTRTTPEKSDNRLPTCPGVDMDFSAFTITGEAATAFARRPATVQSNVEVFKSRSDAFRDFRKATRAPFLRCLGRWLREQLPKEVPGGRMVSAGVRARPRVGEQALAYRTVMDFPADGGRVRVYVDLLGIQRGRTGVTLTFARPQAPLGGQLAVARKVVARMR